MATCGSNCSQMFVGISGGLEISPSWQKRPTSLPRRCRSLHTARPSRRTCEQSSRLWMRSVRAKRFLQHSNRRSQSRLVQQLLARLVFPSGEHSSRNVVARRQRHPMFAQACGGRQKNWSTDRCRAGRKFSPANRP